MFHTHLYAVIIEVYDAACWLRQNVLVNTREQWYITNDNAMHTQYKGSGIFTNDIEFVYNYASKYIER